MAAHPVYVASRGGQDRYVTDVEAPDAASALDRYCADHGVTGIRHLVHGQERMQTTGVLYLYTYSDKEETVIL